MRSRSTEPGLQADDIGLEGDVDVGIVLAALHKKLPQIGVASFN